MAFAKIFGLILWLAGIIIALGWSMWTILNFPNFDTIKKKHFYNFPNPNYSVFLFVLPATALILGVTLISLFLIRTTKAIEAKKAAAAKAAAAKKGN
mmetsp:Transcript_33653/g.45267  ORF Transcript_33653/g.45267 Transcript_33653/m.45267 type:complete len:97 (-) Transcript_33653:107-397(-)